MLKLASYKITGVSPLLMHNGLLADPLNPVVKQLKKVSQKRDKTDADLEELARLEWYGSLYLDHGEPCIPGEVLEATLINAAKKKKKGPAAKAGLICDGNVAVLYDGPRNPDAMWEDGSYRFATGVVVNRSRVIRTRPIFREWSLEFRLSYNDELLNESDLSEFVKIGGEIIGLAEWRPKFGRYMVDRK
jgi:hypothetical protein